MQTHQQHLCFQAKADLDQLELISNKIAKELATEKFFCLWLVGDIGAGKTTLAGLILRHLGLASEIPVTSPTFTYLSDYKIGPKTYAHLDFYRISAKNPPLSAFLNDLEYEGMLVEWPENLGEQTHAIQPTHVLEIAKSPDLLSRFYQFFKVAVMP